MEKNQNKRKLDPNQTFVVSYIIKNESGEIRPDTDTFGLHDTIVKNGELSDGEIAMHLSNVIYDVYKDCYHKVVSIAIVNWWLY